MAVRMSQRVGALTPRQLEVVRLVSLGCSVAEISAILGLAVSTVDNHKVAAMNTLGVDKSTVLTRVAIKHRISTLNDQLTRGEKRKLGKTRRARS
jgi:DNA-binding NarL/FixJ family response regulator